MRAGRKHFYQHRIDFALYGDALVIGYATDFTYEMLTATERAEFTRHVKPGQWKRNFEQYFKAFVKQKPAYLPDEPKPIQQAKLSILDSLFEPVVLAKRAGIVANFTYRKWQDQV
jgi:hypothetical protein